MNIVIIPGFTGYPEEKTFESLEKRLLIKNHNVVKIAWSYFPDDLSKYSFTKTINSAHKILNSLKISETIILGFSMGGIIATYLAKEFEPKKLALVVSPYQAGSEDDLEGKYKNWKETGYRDLSSSKYGNLRIPFSFIEDARKYNALEIIPDVYCPILFIVGEKDDKVPNKVTRKLFDKANEPKDMVIIEGMEHKYQYQPEIIEQVNNHLIKFISD